MFGIAVFGIAAWLYSSYSGNLALYFLGLAALLTWHYDKSEK